MTLEESNARLAALLKEEQALMGNGVPYDAPARQRIRQERLDIKGQLRR